MSWDVWNSIGENPDKSYFAEQPNENEQILEVCGLDRNEHLFIEKTAAMPHHDGMRKFLLTAAVEQDGIVSIRPVDSEPSRAFKVVSSLFQICRVEGSDSTRVVYARPFEPLPDWPRAAEA